MVRGVPREGNEDENAAMLPREAIEADSEASDGASDSVTANALRRSYSFFFEHPILELVRAMRRALIQMVGAAA
jgi:hypothetical protein